MLKSKIVEFVGRGEFGLASGKKSDGTFDRVWFTENVAPDEVAFEADVFLLRKVLAAALKEGGVAPEPPPKGAEEPDSSEESKPEPSPQPTGGNPNKPAMGNSPPEVWNRLGTKILPKLRSGSELSIGFEFSVKVSAESAVGLGAELRQILQELGLGDAVRVE